MQYFNLLENFGIAVGITSIVCAAVDFLLNKFCVKLPKIILSYASGVLTVILNFAIDMITVQKGFRFSTEALYGGIIAASVGKILSFTLAKIIRGEKADEEVALAIIRSYLYGLMGENRIGAAAIDIYSVIVELNKDDADRDAIRDKIVEIIKNNVESCSPGDLNLIAKLIMSSVEITLNTDKHE